MLKDKKILFISSQPFFEWRGSPIRVLYNLIALSQNNAQIDFLTLPIGQNKEISNVKIIRSINPFKIKEVAIGPSFKKLVFDFLMFFQSWMLMKKNRYDIIHTIEDTGIIGTVLAKCFNTKHIHEKHSDTQSYKKGKLKNFILYVYSKVEFFVIKHAHAVIGTGPMIVLDVKKDFPSKPCYHIFDIPSSLQTATAEKSIKIKNQLKTNSDEIVILYVGSFAIYQGIELMFSSIPLVVEKMPNARFVIIGGTKKEIEEKQTWLTEKKADKKVSFLGKIEPDNLVNYLAAADILLSPRISGYNTPLKLLDYLKAGKAIIATDYKANRQILNNQNCLFAQTNKESFSNTIITLLNDPDLRKKLSENSTKLITEKYNFKNYSKMIQKCYDQLFQ